MHGTQLRGRGISPRMPLRSYILFVQKPQRAHGGPFLRPLGISEV